MVEILKERLQFYFESMIPPHVAREVEEGNPNLTNGYWGPGWCTAEPQTCSSESCLF